MLTLFLLSMISPLASAAAPPAADPATEEAVQAVVAAYGPFVRGLDQPIYTYSYVKRENLGLPPQGPIDRTKPEVARHVEKWTSYYWSTQGKFDSRVSGLYLALDPVSSRDYGGKNWLLYRLALPTGHRYVDQQAEPKNVQKVRAALTKAGCKADGEFEKLSLSDLIFVYFFGSKCREIANEALRRLDVDSLFYNWHAVTFANCPERPQQAIILLRSDRLGPGAERIFSEDEIGSTSGGDRSEHAATQALFPISQGLPDQLANNSQMLLWPKEMLPAVTQDKLHSWMQEHLLGCQQKQPKAAQQKECGASQKAPNGVETLQQLRTNIPK